jgi:hypothetical protein
MNATTLSSRDDNNVIRCFEPEFLFLFPCVWNFHGGSISSSLDLSPLFPRHVKRLAANL